MTSASEIPAKEVMETDFESVKIDQSLASAKNQLERNGRRAMPVVDGNKKLKGAIGYRDIVRGLQFNPETTKLEKVLHKPPEIDEGASLVDLAELRIESGKKMLVKTQGNRLKGLVSDKEFLKAFESADELENLQTKDIRSSDLMKVFEDDSIEKTRHRMLDQNISRLPVVDNNGKLTGMVTSVELLRAMVMRESYSSGGASGNRDGEEYFSEGGGERKSLSDIPVREIMERNVVTTDQTLTGTEIVELMLSEDTNEVLEIEDKYPKSIITTKDFIDYFSEYKESETVLVSLVGLEVDEEKAAVHEKIKNQLRGSLGRKLKRPEEIKLRFKKSDKDEKSTGTKLKCSWSRKTTY